MATSLAPGRTNAESKRTMSPPFQSSLFTKVWIDMGRLPIIALAQASISAKFQPILPAPWGIAQNSSCGDEGKKHQNSFGKFKQ